MTSSEWESLFVGVGGGLLGAVVGRGVAGAPGTVFGATVGAVNGVVSGRRRIYDWSSRSGPIAFVLDSTWSLGNTTAGVMSHAIGAIRGEPGYVDALSRRQDRHVYRRGFQPRRGFAITLGNVISGAGDADRPRRAKLVTDHEHVHAWQARWFGPAYPVLYLGWTAGGAAAGVVLWLRRERRHPLWSTVESCAYYLNPFEWWAYSRDDHWPPSGKEPGLGWKRPIVRSFASRDVVSGEVVD